MFLEARVGTTTYETYAWQSQAQLCDLLSSPVRINPHACVRHAPHYADTSFSGNVKLNQRYYKFRYGKGLVRISYNCVFEQWRVCKIRQLSGAKMSGCKLPYDIVL